MYKQFHLPVDILFLFWVVDLGLALKYLSFEEDLLMLCILQAQVRKGENKPWALYLRII